MEIIAYNLNFEIKIKIKDAGIEYYVRKHNEILPFRLHTSFTEFKNKADVDGFHTMQMHSFVDIFGCLGLGLADFVDADICFIKR